MNKKMTLRLLASGVLYAVALAGCDSGTSMGTNPTLDLAAGPDMAAPADMTVVYYGVGGSVTGLAGTGLVLQLNGGEELPVNASGPFTFSQKVAAGSNYSVSVKTQPSGPAQTCTVMSGSGAVGSADVSNVAVVCSTTTFKVGGSVTGLTGTLVLQNNGGDDLTLTQSGAFAFNTQVASGARYAVTVKTHPKDLLCTVAAGSGPVTSADITNVAVTCAPPKTCKEIKTVIPTAMDGDYKVDPDGAGALPAITVYCDMTTDGGGYTMYGVTGGKVSSRTTDANSCTDVGLKIIIPRTKAHLGSMWKKYGAGYFTAVPGISGKAAGVYTGCTMNSGDATCGANWVAIDQGAWFLRDGAYSEPNGDYTPGCWLGVTTGLDANGNLGFNDANCNYSTGTMYVCSDNAK
ncbi:MAG: fibrinogen-like YCDxxxxGGGW domain-containing protein [Polyangia bacterium]